MADLPDIDTTEVSFIAYWNAIDDGGVGSIDPVETQNDPNVVSSTIYDNGIEGVYDLSPLLSNKTREVNFRVKNDGWMVVYSGTGETFGKNLDASQLDGPWDIISDWTTPNGTTISANTFERAINNLQSNLSNSGSIFYQTSDVGLYNYEYPSSTAATLFHADGGSRNDKTDFGFLYTSGTEVYWCVIAGVCDTLGTTNSAEVLSPSGTSIVESGGDSVEWGTYDMIANNEIPNSDTEYQLEHPAFERAQHSNILLWG